MRQRLAIFALFGVGYFLSNFFRAANAVIAGDLTRELGLAPADLGLMTALFYAGFALVQLPLGAALDRLGPRVAVPALMSLTVAGCLIFAAATALPQAALGRTLIGVGMAGNLMGAVKAFGLWFAPQRVATVTSLMVGIGALGALVAATPLAALSAAIGWRAVFSWGALATLASALAILLWVRTAPPQVEWRASGQVRDGGFGLIFRDPQFWRIAPLCFWLLGTMLAVQTLWGGPYLFDVLGLTPIAAGNLLLVLSGGVAAGYFACGWLADRYGAARMAATAMAVNVVCQLLLLAPQLTAPAGLIAPVLAAFGFTGAFNLVLLAQVRALFPPQLSGRAVTAVNLFGFAGAALVQWWMGLVIGRFPLDAAGRSPTAAYSTALAFTALCCALSLLWYLRPERRSAAKPAAG